MFVPKFQYHDYGYNDSNISLHYLYNILKYKYFWIPHDVVLGNIYSLHSSLVTKYDTYSVSEFHRHSSRMYFTDTAYIVFDH